MATYCSYQDVINRYSPIGTDPLAAQKVAAAIADAQSVIDAALKAKFNVPFVPTPALIKTVTIRLATAIAAVMVFSGSGIDSEPHIMAAEKLEHSANVLLADILTGTIQMIDYVTGDLISEYVPPMGVSVPYPRVLDCFSTAAGPAQLPQIGPYG